MQEKTKVYQYRKLTVKRASSFLSLVKRRSSRHFNDADTGAPDVLKKSEDTKINHDICDLCDRNWVFILATGRSGSTTILNMLNLLPGVYLSGETGRSIEMFRNLPYFSHNSFSQHLQGYHLLLHGPYKHGEINENNLKCIIQEFFFETRGTYTLMKKDPIIFSGFKEISLKGPQSFNFIQSVFPCARFVINYRKNVTQQHESYFQKNKDLKCLIEETEELLHYWKNKENAVLLPLEDFSISSFNLIAYWLGYNNCTYPRVLHANQNGYEDDFTANVSDGCTFAY
eukprot:snap_masked-scaffold_9-processed-gene-4.38-mRNA-1 protein AED:1.00 eAED:1.00 QI:0/0/0/0/1/1/2/0/284